MLPDGSLRYDLLLRLLIDASDLSVTLFSTISIRPYQLEDTPLLFAAVMDSKQELAPWLPWCHENYSLDDSRSWVESQITAFAKRTEYALVISDSDGTFLGGCGLNHLDELNRSANLGYWVRTSCCKRGVATVAVRQLVPWAFSNTDLVRLEVVVAVENVASQRVAEKSGAVFEATLRSRLRLSSRMHDVRVYSFVRGSPESEH